MCTVNIRQHANENGLPGYISLLNFISTASWYVISSVKLRKACWYLYKLKHGWLNPFKEDTGIN